jgi:hypothetical protein
VGRGSGMKPVQVKDFETQLGMLWMIPIISGAIFFVFGPIPGAAKIL